MKLGVFEVLEKASKITNEDLQIQFLRDNRSPALETVVIGAYYPGVNWLLPEQEPPYRELDPVNAETFLHFEAKRLYLFAEGGKQMSNTRREDLFIEMLESVHPQDAKVLLAMINKRLPYDGLSVELFHKAYPDLGLIEEDVEEEVSEEA